MVRLAPLFVAAAILAAPAAYADPAPAPADPAAASQNQQSGSTESRAGRVRDPDRRRCVYSTTVGSRLSRRICRTNAEWEEIETAASRQAAERGAGGVGMRCDGDASTCGGVGRIGGPNGGG